MPDAAGNFKGVGWSQRSSDAWTRVFGKPELGAFGLPRPDVPDLMAALEASLSAVPSEPSREVEPRRDDWTPEDYDQRRSAFRTCD
jgi:hypothetical protein